MAKLMTVIKQFAAKPNNDLFAAAARPHDPADYSRPALDGSGCGRQPPRRHEAGRNARRLAYAHARGLPRAVGRWGP